MSINHKGENKMAMKFKMISDDDVKTIRAARKALTRIAKKLRRLNATADDALANSSKDYKLAALANYRMLDEVEALGISSLDGCLLSISLLPSSNESKAIEL